MNNSTSITIGKYHLEPLLNIRQDNIPSMLGTDHGVYICEYAEPDWYKNFDLTQMFNRSIEKKRLMHLQMAEESKWVSPTSDVPKWKRTQAWRNGNILHLSYISLPFRLGQFIQTASLFSWLWTNRQKYKYCLVYNFYLPYYLAPLMIKYIFRKKLFVDYEDDYTLQRNNPIKNILERILRRTTTGAICVNESMAQHFTDKQVRVVNGFADLEYSKNADFTLKDGMVFLFSGSLDKIRGVELIPDLVRALRQHIMNFQIFITGDGPLKSLVVKWTFPEVKFLGFLNDIEYERIMKETDACLVLQKPDHPFNRGSFPSKIDNYAKFQKPIFILKEIKNKGSSPLCLEDI